VVARHVEMPPRPDPDAPGPFAFANRDRLRTLLDGAGFGDIAIESLERPLIVAASVAQATEFALDMGPASTALQQAPPKSDLRQRLTDDLNAFYQGHVTGKGVALGAATWVVSARLAV
jgi:hypothetical protein